MAIFFFKGLYWYPTKAMKMVYHTYKQEYEQLIIHHNITSWILEYFHIITNNNIIKSKHRPLFSFLQLASQFFISTFLLPLIHSNLPTRLFNLSISSFFCFSSKPQLQFSKRVKLFNIFVWFLSFNHFTCNLVNLSYVTTFFI